MIKAVFRDFGGVFTTSPFEAFNRWSEMQALADLWALLKLDFPS